MLGTDLVVIHGVAGGTEARSRTRCGAATERSSCDGKRELQVDLKRLFEEQRVVTGVHEVYGEIYWQLGLDRLLPHARYRASHNALFHTAMARIANPDSKRGSVRRLEEDFGSSLARRRCIG